MANETAKKDQDQVKDTQVTETKETKETKQESVGIDEPKASELFNKFGTKSAAIRHLDSKGYSRGQIAKHLGLRYQHVRNVLITPLKRDQSAPAQS